MIAAFLLFGSTPPATAQVQGEDLEPFRRELSQYVSELETLPPALLDAVYDHPETLADAQERVARMTPEELRALKGALDRLPHWQSLPALLQASAGAIAGPGAFSPVSQVSPVSPVSLVPQAASSMDPETFRAQWLEILGEMKSLPPEVVRSGFHENVSSLEGTFATLTEDQLRELQLRMVERLPEWTRALQASGAERIGPLGHCDNSFPRPSFITPSTTSVCASKKLPSFARTRPRARTKISRRAVST